MRVLRFALARLLAPEVFARRHLRMQVTADTTQAHAALERLRDEIERVDGLAVDRRVACDLQVTIRTEVQP